MSETIWSNSKSSPLGNDGSNMNYKNVFDHIDPDVAKILSYNDPIGASDLVSDSDVSSNRFGLRTGALSAITAPAGGYNNNNTSPNQQHQRLGLGTASISGGIANRHPPQDSFLQKFSGVADATRDIELTNNFGALNLEGSSRRTSFNNQTPKPTNVNDIGYSSPTGSLNESLNYQPTRTSRHQSISDKIDQYNNSSPIQAGATLNVATEKDDRIVPPPTNNIWNPAAQSFNPAVNNSFQDMYSGYQRNGMIPINPGPFVMSSPPPPVGFIDPRMYNMGAFPMGSSDSAVTNGSSESTNDADAEESEMSEEASKAATYKYTPGIGMPRQNPGFVFQPFTPYSMYQSPPAMNVIIQDTTGEGKEPVSNQKPKANAPRSSSTPDSNTPPTNGNNGNGKGKKNGNGKFSKGAPHIYRSPLLEEVRSNFKGKEYYLKDIYGHAVEFTKDQHGSRFIQQKLPDASDEEKEMIFNEIRDISYELMTDVFGNYVIQKYFEYGSTTQKNILLEYMLGHIYELSLQMYGCRVVQRALEALALPGQIKIISELKDHVLICAKDQNGNHVIQKSIERIPFEKVRFILDSLENQIYHLSTHPYGCRVIQRLLEHSTPTDQRNILGELNRFIFYLIQDQYGNYVMQHILERGSEEDREEILTIVLGSVVNFSKHKFASNVIEKCIKFGDLNQRKRILHEVLLGNEDLAVETVSDDSPLALMMKDQYANYVIQKLVEVFDTKSQQKRLLVLKLRQYLKQLSSKNSYGKHLASVEKMIIVAETALIEADNS